MKTKVFRDEYKIYTMSDQLGTDVEIPESQADWISGVFADFHEAQTYLAKAYEKAIRGNRRV